MRFTDSKYRRGVSNPVSAPIPTDMPRWATTDEQKQAVTSTHPKHGKHTWGIRSHGRVTPLKEDSAPPTSSKCCMRGIATAYDDPGFIRECTKVATLILQVFNPELYTWDVTNAETVFSKNTSREFDNESTLFKRCYFLNQIARIGQVQNSKSSSCAPGTMSRKSFAPTQSLSYPWDVVSCPGRSGSWPCATSTVDHTGVVSLNSIFLSNFNPSFQLTTTEGYYSRWLASRTAGLASSALEKLTYVGR